jgi:hypothetical protein
MNKKLIIAVVALVAIAGTAFAVVGHHKDPTGASHTAVQQVLAYQQVDTSDDAQKASKSNTAALVDMIDITDPYDVPGYNTVTSGTQFLIPDDGKFGSIISMTPYEINTNQVKLPNDFSIVGTDMVKMTSGQPVTIIEEFTFDQDSALTWNKPDSTTSKYKWAKHPDAMYFKQGEQALVSFTSVDGGENWYAEVNKGPEGDPDLTLPF